ncbi:MAG: hypothetical protein V3T98_02575, partial [Candidatus Paceibacterota bacterium]
MTLTKEQLKKEKVLSRLIDEIFNATGFDSVNNTDSVNITVGNETSDFDNIFFYKNKSTIIFIERTIRTNSKNRLSDHARKKKDYFKACCDRKQIFLDQLKSKFPKLRTLLRTYSTNEINLAYIYTSYESLGAHYKKRYSNLHFWDLKQLYYFFTLASIIKKTARHEIFSFLGIPLQSQNIQSSAIPWNKYRGMI